MEKKNFTNSKTFFMRFFLIFCIFFSFSKSFNIKNTVHYQRVNSNQNNSEQIYTKPVSVKKTFHLRLILKNNQNFLPPAVTLRFSKNTLTLYNNLILHHISIFKHKTFANEQIITFLQKNNISHQSNDENHPLL